MEEYYSSDKLLKLQLGAIIQASSEVGALSFSSRLVGIDKDRTIITSLPEKLLCEADTLTHLTPGKLFEIKTIHEGKVVAFESTVIDVYSNRLLISSFPEMIETRRLRKDVRFPCAISCDIKFNNMDFSAVITDISMGGCRLTIHKDTSYEFLQDASNWEKQIDMAVFFPTSEESELLNVEIKSADCQIDETCKVGLAFAQDFESVRQYLESLQLDSVSPFFY